VFGNSWPNLAGSTCLAQSGWPNSGKGFLSAGGDITNGTVPDGLSPSDLDNLHPGYSEPFARPERHCDYQKSSLVIGVHE
jgi:hypothetical protein